MLDAPALVWAMALYAQALEEFRGEIDSLNVFPVPDGDTGTNLLHTQRAVVGALSADAAGHDDGAPDMAGIAETIAHAALTGARGNSGVILSQVLRAFCAALPSPRADAPSTGADGPTAGADGPTVAAALQEAAKAARLAVAQPKAGTVLTVLDSAAEWATHAAETDSVQAGPGGTDPGPSNAEDVLEAALAGARKALERTQTLLPELSAAGVVDAGGKGAVLLLDSLHAAVTGGALTEPLGPAGPLGSEAAARTPPPPLTFAYEVEFLLEGPKTSDPGGLRAALADMGDSLAIVGGDALYRVHIHTDRPDEVLTTAARVGTVFDASTTSLEEQVADCLGHAARAVQAGAATCVLIAVLEPSGVADVIRSLGAVVVKAADDDGCTTARIEEAMASTSANGVVVLAENALARRLRRLTGMGSAHDVAIVTAPNPAALLSAAAEFHPDASPAANVAAMTGAAGHVRTGDLSSVDGPTGAAAGSLGDLVAELAADAPDAEVLTLVAGTAVTDDELAVIAADLATRFPSLRVEPLRGGRRDPAYQVGLE
jgi:DAK2 domain fusion protein YloV